MNQRLLKGFLCGAALQCGVVTAAADTQSDNGRPADEWRLVWSDEFDKDELDPGKWGFDVDCWGGGNEERQCYTSSKTNAFIDDGKLHIVARREEAEGHSLPPHLRTDPTTPPEIVKRSFTSARVNTKGKADWKYGRIEVRAKLPRGQGMWPAIWMLPSENTYGNWAASGEIDILEAVNLGASCPECDGGRENRIFGTLHFGGEWPHNTHKGNKVRLPVTEDGFNTFAVEWQEGRISWFVDGAKYSTLNASDWYSKSPLAENRPAAPFDQPFYLILNVAVGGRHSEDHNDGGVSLDGFPKSMIVDWVRVYQHAHENKS